MDAAGSVAPTAPLFRPSKKRKIYRHRADDDEAVKPLSEATASSESPTNDEEILHEDRSISEILRLRKLRKQRGGVEFRVDQHERREEEGDAIEAIETEPRDLSLKKFASQTGTVGDVNKHMIAYIDAKLASRDTQNQTKSIPETGAVDTAPLCVSDSKDAQKQPAALGKLLEIDLGDQMRAENVERTEQARRRLAGDIVEEDVEGGRKPRLRRDGRPWKTRKRKTSEEIKRDKLVDEVLRENKLEMYEEPSLSSQAFDNQAADERIAEEFRREFMDSSSNRQRRKPAAMQPIRGKREDEPKGPKLGGSRSARAAMREQQLRKGKR